jgi:uncharacterized OB-fold protein
VGNNVPIVDYLVIDDGAPYITAHECVSCGALFFDRRNGCAQCSGRVFTSRRLGDTG